MLPNTPRLCHLETVSDETPTYRWPWLVLLLFIFGAALAGLWMLAEVKRTQRQRNFMYPPVTNMVTTTNKN